MTTTRTITLDTVLAAAAPYLDSDQTNPQAPNFRGTLCVYTAHDGTHCVAGQILADLDIPLPAQEETWKTVIYSGRALLDVEMNRQGVMRLAEWLAAVHDVRLDPAAVSALNTAQGDTDSGLEWGRALREGGVL